MKRMPRVALTLVLGVWVVTVVTVVTAVAGVAAATTVTTTVPYHDTTAVGYIGLCNQSGHQVTSGNLSTTPFAWRAVSSVGAPAPYSNSWRTAILIAYQPQNGLFPGEWSGEELTASTRYTNPAHPMAEATKGDESLATFVADFPLHWDNFIELRLYLGARNAPVYSLHYPALNIKVTGSTWRAVGGGPVDCTDGSATSLESIVLPSTTTTTTSSTSSTLPTTSTSSASSSSTTTIAHALGTTSSSTTGIIVALAAVVLAATSGAILVARRRCARSSRSQPDSPNGK